MFLAEKVLKRIAWLRQQLFPRIRQRVGQVEEKETIIKTGRYDARIPGTVHLIGTPGSGFPLQRARTFRQRAAKGGIERSDQAGFDHLKRLASLSQCCLHDLFMNA
ncbi:hypothetical protein [Thiorhodovibrio litoralis]|uniref:hypothetical protein n=1 Tax=Thiorhodovibrio litoralis TaxID=2952932 RepID=UPI002B262A0F|nr:hypothetical protein [Thiorhodovibrio litoralis]